MKSIKKPFIALASFVGVASVLLGLTSCFAMPSFNEGQSAVAAEQTWQGLEGVDFVNFETQDWETTIKFTQTGTNLMLRVDINPDYHISNTEAFLDFAVKTAWSVKEKQPEGSLKIVVVGGVDHKYDWHDEVLAVSGDNSYFLTTTEDRRQSSLVEEEKGVASVIIINDSSLESALGKWPSNPPVLSEPFISKGAVEEILPSGINSPFISGMKTSNQKCVSVLGERGQTYDPETNELLAIYDQDVSVSLLVDGKVQETKLVLFDMDKGRGYVSTDFCFSEAQFPSGEISVKIVGEDTEYFLGMDREIKS